MNGALAGLAAAAPALAMIAVLVLLGFGARTIWRGEDRRRGLLMLVAALVLLGNVLIWTL